MLTINTLFVASLPGSCKIHCTVEEAWEQGYIIANLSLYPSLHLHADLQASTCAVASDCRPVCCLKLLYSWQRIVDGHWVIGIVVRNQTSAWVRFSYADEAWYWLKWNNPVLYRTSRPLFTDWEMWFIQCSYRIAPKFHGSKISWISPN